MRMFKRKHVVILSSTNVIYWYLFSLASSSFASSFNFVALFPVLVLILSRFVSPSPV